MGGDVRLEMMGGEFCGNASRSIGTVSYTHLIIDIEVDDGSMVEYGKTLFKVKRI